MSEPCILFVKREHRPWIAVAVNTPKNVEYGISPEEKEHVWIPNTIAAASLDLLKSLGATLHALETPGDFTEQELADIMVDASQVLDNLAKARG